MPASGWTHDPFIIQESPESKLELNVELHAARRLGRNRLSE
jgi:hypothetical protein